MSNRNTSSQRVLIDADDESTSCGVFRGRGEDPRNFYLPLQLLYAKQLQLLQSHCADDDDMSTMCE